MPATTKTTSIQRPPDGTPLSQISAWLDQLLNISAFSDSSLNGVQVEASTVVRTIGAAVDAGESVILDAVEKGVDLLIVHHGLFWDQLEAVRGPLGRKIGALIKGEVSLYAAHLPLDAHMEFGNGILIARQIGLGSVRSAMNYRGSNVGVVGENSLGLKRNEIAQRLKTLGGYGPAEQDVLVLPFGPEVPRQIGVITGSGCSAIADAAKEGFDTLVTGEPRQSAYHECREAGINLICAGHYATETVGVRELARITAENFGIKQIFLDCPTGI